MATLTDTLETVLLLKGGQAFIRGLADAASHFAEIANVAGTAAAANTFFAASMDALTSPVALVTIGIAALGAAFKAASDATNEFAANERILVPLAIELRNLGNAFPVDEAVAFANQMQTVTGISHRATQQLILLASSFGLTKQQTEKLIPAVFDVAVSRQMNPEQVLRKLFQTSGGRVQGLRVLGFDPNKMKGDLTDINNLADQLEKTLGGTAEAFRNTLPGTMDAFASATQSLNEAWGRFFSPYTIGFLNALTFLAEGLTNLLNAGAEYWRLPIGTQLGQGKRPDISLKGDPEQTGLLGQIAANTAHIGPLIAKVAGGSGEVATKAFTRRDYRIAFGA